jgi:membrane-bound lytic murein transglycosylase D
MSGGAKTISFIAVFAGLTTLAVSAQAAYDQPVTWSDMSNMDLRPVLQSQYASSENLFQPNVTETQQEIAMRDADSRINPEFHVPPGMENSVRFWLRIYTEFTTQHVVLFDDHHPEIVYEVLDFRQLAKTARNGVIYEIVQHQRIQKAIDKYRRALNKLAKNPHPKRLSPEQVTILAALKKAKHKHSFKDLAQNLRAQTGQRDNIIKGLLAAESFFPKMEQIFTKMGIPLELTRLALVESSFNLGATSRVGAAGVWQFMPKSGKEFLLIDDRYQIDERISPLKATVAAGRLLKRNRKTLGSWALAVTSYNHGLRGLRRIPASQKRFEKLSSVFSPDRKNSPLGWASRNYYSEFLAVVHAEAYRNLFYGQPPVSNMRPIMFVRVNKPQNAMAIALEHGASVQDLRLLNPDVKNLHKKLPKGFWLAVPGTEDDLAGLTRRIAPLKGST